MPEKSDWQLMLGNLAIERGLITPEQLASALEDQMGDKDRLGFVRHVGTILVSRGWLTEPVLMDLLGEQSRERARLREAARPKDNVGTAAPPGKELFLGNMALEAKLITPEQLRVALADQAQDQAQGRVPRQLGIILLGRGWLSEADLLALLAEQAKRRARRQGPPPPAR